MDIENINQLWRLHEELTIDQAASLVAGYDPELLSICRNDTAFHERFNGFVAAKSAISNALRRGTISGVVVPIYEYDINGNVCGEIDSSVDHTESRVDVDSLKSWLVSRGFKTGFFFPETTDAPKYLDPSHPRHSYELAAAVHAWEAMEDENLRKGKSAKKAIEDWLNSRYKELHLYHTKENEKNGTKPGNVNNSAISRIAVVANWNPEGGATPTPVD